MNITESNEIDSNFRESYVLAFGELGNFTEASAMQFVIFTFLWKLTGITVKWGWPYKDRKDLFSNFKILYSYKNVLST